MAKFNDSDVIDGKAANEAIEAALAAAKAESDAAVKAAAENRPMGPIATAALDCGKAAVLTAIVAGGLIAVVRLSRKGEAPGALPAPAPVPSSTETTES